ncbi:MAG TPA: C2 family cysteine protease [Tepidisphaeraceae bacterium]
MFKTPSTRTSTPKNKLFTGKSIVARRRAIYACESLESRRLLSGVGLSALSEATVLRPMKLKATATAGGNVGGLVSDNLYKFDVTAPINLQITLSNLKQSDSVTLLFEDGSGLSTGGTNGAKASGFYQRLDPGTYYLDIGIGFAASAGKAPATRSVSHKRITGPTTGYKLKIHAVAPDGTAAPVPDPQGPGGLPIPTGGFGVEPDISNVNNFAGWNDFSANPLFATGGPSPDDIVQGGVGDCYFLATLSDIARNDPGLIQQDVTQLANGTFQVKFERNGQDVFENVDASFAVDTAGKPVFAGLGTGGSIWVAVMEKAFCFFRHPDQPASYSQIDFGSGAEVFADLGGSNLGSLFAYQFRTGSQLVSEINNELAAGAVIDYASSQQAVELVPSHVYSVVQVNGDGTVMMRNPWGFNQATPGDGGYLNLTGDQLLANVNGFTSCTFTAVPTTIIPQPTPQPTPTPPPSSQLVVIGTGTLGSNSFDLQNGRWGDAFVITATASGTADVVMESNAFAPTVEVLQINDDNSTALVVYDSNSARSVDAVGEFQAIAGTRYEVVLSSVDPSVGNYAIGITSNLGSYQPFSPTA